MKNLILLSATVFFLAVDVHADETCGVVKSIKAVDQDPVSGLLQYDIDLNDGRNLPKVIIGSHMPLIAASLTNNIQVCFKQRTNGRQFILSSASK